MQSAEELLKELTLEEKISLLSGQGLWNTKAIERVSLPSLMLTDGPIGIRKQTGAQDNVGLNKSVNSTCFPAGTTIACSWDRELFTEMGQALGEEAQALDVGILLGPAMNIKRTPLCGRNFEYLSEDPYLTGALAAAYVKGVQSQGVATSLKHFAANNQEYRRRSVNAVIDERTLREIYLSAFEMAVKEAKPATVMSSYNRVNGVYASENRHLLTEILRNEWGFEGVVVSDWDATNDHALGLKNGLDLRMPCLSDKDAKDMMAAYHDGRITEEEIDAAVLRNLRLILTAVENHRPQSMNSEAHHALVRKLAGESMILLKNDRNVLPLGKNEKVAIIGGMAKNLRYQGGGSSHVEPFRCDDVLEEMAGKASVPLVFESGYDLESDERDDRTFSSAVEAAKHAEKVVIFAGLPERYESEGYDREHMDLPPVQNELIEAVAAVNPNTVVVLANGAAVVMPWAGQVSGILESYLGGEAAGGAIADLLYGDVNPSGKLAETFPVNIRQTPSYLNYPGYQDNCVYHEGVFVGYRYYAAKAWKPLFPFGFGLSYTKFSYSDLSVDRTSMNEDEEAVVTLKVKNIGSVAGKEIVQLYIRDNESSIPRPEFELRNFAKVQLQPGEEKVVRFTLSFRDFAYYDVDMNRFAVESGKFTILVGGSSDALSLSEVIAVKALHEKKKVYTPYSTFGDIMSDPDAWPKMQELAMRDPFYNMVFSGKFQNTDPEKLLGYNLLKELGDTDTIGEAALIKLLHDINQGDLSHQGKK